MNVMICVVGLSGVRQVVRRGYGGVGGLDGVREEVRWADMNM